MRKNGRQLEALYAQYARPLYYYLLKLCGSQQLAEDLTQETFVRATIHLHTYADEEARGWLYKVARNVYLDEWRKQKRRKEHPFLHFFYTKEEMISPYGIPEESILMHEQSAELSDLLQFLPEQYRTILFFREVEQFSYAEIMDAMQLTEEQVKVQLHRARNRLAQLATKKGWSI